MQTPIEVSRTVPTDIQTTWQALTIRDVMVQWYFDNIPIFEAEVGFETAFVVHSADRVFTHQWRVLQVDPPHFISYAWRFDEYEGESYSDFSLQRLATGTKVMVRCRNLDSFPSDIPEFSRESCTAGWNYFMDRLQLFLDHRLA